MTIEQMFLMQT
jgi:hypothetical protein